MEKEQKNKKEQKQKEKKELENAIKKALIEEGINKDFIKDKIIFI